AAAMLNRGRPDAVLKGVRARQRIEPSRTFQGIAHRIEMGAPDEGVLGRPERLRLLLGQCTPGGAEGSGSRLQTSEAVGKGPAGLVAEEAGDGAAIGAAGHLIAAIGDAAGVSLPAGHR